MLRRVTERRIRCSSFNSTLRKAIAKARYVVDEQYLCPPPGTPILPTT